MLNNTHPQRQCCTSDITSEPHVINAFWKRILGVAVKVYKEQRDSQHCAIDSLKCGLEEHLNPSGGQGLLLHSSCRPKWRPTALDQWQISYWFVKMISSDLYNSYWTLLEDSVCMCLCVCDCLSTSLWKILLQIYVAERSWKLHCSWQDSSGLRLSGKRISRVICFYTNSGWCNDSDSAVLSLIWKCLSFVQTVLLILNSSW